MRALACVLILLALMAGACAGPEAGSASEQGAARAQTVQNKGSDTLVNLALAWAETYMGVHSDVRISVTGGGSGTGIAAMINGTVDLANASRAMKQEEIDAARKNGIEPVEHVVARDAIAVVLHPSNPVQGLTLQQVSDIYTGKITNWLEVGGEDRPIVLLSRESNSGTYVYFLEEVIRGGEESDLLFSPDTLLMPSSEGISAEVRQNPNAIGLMRNGDINLIINTPSMKSGARRDGYVMRRLAVELEIPFMTTVQGADIAVNAIQVARGHDMSVNSMKDFHSLV